MNFVINVKVYTNTITHENDAEKRRKIRKATERI